MVQCDLSDFSVHLTFVGQMPADFFLADFPHISVHQSGDRVLANLLAVHLNYLDRICDHFLGGSTRWRLLRKRI